MPGASDTIATPGHGGPQPDGLELGTTLAGRYTVVAYLGQGATARVYEAEDRLLGGRVALKVVHAVAAGREDDSHAAARLRREVQLARRVSHPNVCRMHDVVLDRQGGTLRVFLSMELCAGETLAARLSREGPMPVAAATPLVAQMAAALEAAHQAGVVHRDFKPANVMLVPDGAGLRVVVTDFGIARPLDEGGATLTGTGNVVGTPAYMAPEQVEGKPLTAAADVYALGIVMFELVTGALPFQGEKLAVAVRRTQERAPRALSLVPTLDRRWDAAIARCLERRPEDRFRRARDVPAALAGRFVRPRIPAWPLGAALLVAVAAVVGLTRRGGRAPAGPPLVAAAQRLTFDYGCEEYPSFTPDGETLVYDATIDGDYEIAARDLASGRVRRITRAPGWDFGPAVSPDGTLVAYVHAGAARELRVISLAGADMQTLGRTSSFPAWTAGGEILSGEDDGAVVAWGRGSDGWTRRELGRVPSGRFARYLAATRDGRTFALWRDPTRLLTLTLGQVRPGAEAAVLDDEVSATENFLLVSPAGDALYHARKTVGAGLELVRRSLVDGSMSSVPGGLQARSGASISPDGRRLAYSTCGGVDYLSRVGGREPRVELTPRTEFYLRSLAVLDDKTVIFSSNRSGADQLWSLDVVGGAMTPLPDAVGKGSPSSHQCVPSERTGSDAGRCSTQLLAYVDRAHGGVGFLDRSTGEAHPLTADPTDDDPVFTFDGRAVVFDRSDAEGTRLYLVPIDGGAARALTSPGTRFPVVSPVEDLIIYLRRGDDGTSIMATSAAGGPERPLFADLPPGDIDKPDFSPDGQWVSFVRGKTDLVEMPRAGGPARVRYQAALEALQSYAYAPDGDGFVVSLSTWEGDLWIAEGKF